MIRVEFAKNRRPERVLQAAVELRPSDVVLHADVTDAYPSVDQFDAQRDVLRHKVDSF